ncbi:hypothetical protein D1007_19130 [Hordeum vulgare]|nr:hypothetical protein D1007_19130 [Hordeum vulgare]
MSSSPTVPKQEWITRTNKMIRSRGKKWEEEKKKREGVASKMMEKLKDIMAKKYEARVACNEVKEENKAGRFGMFMEMQDKKLKLQDKKL